MKYVRLFNSAVRSVSDISCQLTVTSLIFISRVQISINQLLHCRTLLHLEIEIEIEIKEKQNKRNVNAKKRRKIHRLFSEKLKSLPFLFLLKLLSF